MATRLVPATYASPQIALAACAAWDTILVTSGSYTLQNLSRSIYVIWEWTNDVSIGLTAVGLQGAYAQNWRPAAGSASKRMSLASGASIHRQSAPSSSNESTWTNVDFTISADQPALWCTGPWASTINVNNCTFTQTVAGVAYATRIGIELFGSGTYVNANNCTFTKCGSGVHVENTWSWAKTYRCKFIGCYCTHSAIAAADQYSSLWSTLDVAYSGSGGTAQYGMYYNGGDSARPTYIAKRCTWDVTAGAFYNIGGVRSTVQGCWADAMTRTGAGGTWDHNGSRVYTGTPGTGDVTTLADPGFMNKAGNVYTLALSTCVLVGAGVDISEVTDHAGLAIPNSHGTYSIGAYEFWGSWGGGDTGVVVGITF